MQSYGMTFGFREPYQVLIDAQMIQDTARFKMDLLNGLERVLHGKIKPMITQCSIRHLYTLSVPQSEKDPLILLAKSMERRRCNHHELENPLSTLECLSSVVDPKKSQTNRNRYVVASQDDEVRRFCRGVKGVPLIYVKRSVMVLEPMAESTIGVKEGIERDKFRTGLRARLGKRRRYSEEEKDADTEDRPEGQTNDVDAQDSNERAAKRKKARGPKGPNPLSVKKPKKEKEEILHDSNGNSNLVREKSEDLFESTADIVERVADGTQTSMGKRKRKRKHRPGTIDRLGQEMAEDGQSSS